MNAHKVEPAPIGRLLGLFVLAGLVIVATAACRAEKPTAPGAGAKVEEPLTQATLLPVFGNAKDTKSGLADFTQSDKEIVISYHLYLADLANADQEIARDLAPKIRRLYGRFSSVDRTRFEVLLPDLSSPDEWNPYVSFTMTRKLVKETGWSDLLDTDLLSVAIDVKRTD